jgi:DNA replication protein DnaC/primosomal protein DnaI
LFTVQLSRCSACREALIEPEPEREPNIAALLARSGATPRLKAMSLETYPSEHGGTEAVNHARSWLASYRSGDLRNLYIHGKSGVGKTGLAWGIIKEAMRSEYMEASKSGRIYRHRCELVDMAKHYQSLRDAISTDKPVPFSPATIHLCVLDDVGSERETPWSIEVFSLIVASRYENILPTIITSNYSPEALRNKLARVDAVAADRICSRLCSQALILELDSPDRRRLRLIS